MGSVIIITKTFHVFEVRFSWSIHQLLLGARLVYFMLNQNVLSVDAFAVTN